ncbi:MAG: class I SAM-dependent methyltransferase [Puniceicoccales bacterium]|jgi:2-polyprenyl-3-methyl-5-hydroxy-6-metoxy-1,4-benzoquinol methylase|nr:class I SAM-dependent methyltransferase [Puniceicoccales bacterium]
MTSQGINQEVTTDAFYIKDLEQMKRARNYLKWQNSLIFPFLGKRVIEIGSGIGNFTTTLAQQADIVVGIEPNQYCYSQLVEETKNFSNVSCLNIFSEHIQDHLPLNQRFDTIVSTNVFEHIPDDKKVLDAICPYLIDGARIILQVPAGMWAYGEIDKLLGHYRRYDKSQMKQLFSGIPGQFLKLRYYNPIGALGWWMNARIRKASNQNDRQIWIFDRLILPPQSIVEKIIRFPFGQTIFAVFEYKRKQV